MKKPFVIVGIIVVGIALVAIPIVHGIFRLIGYTSPLEQFMIRKKTEAALAQRYPTHDFDVRTEQPFGEFGYSLRLLATDEEGVEFWMHWNNDELEDHLSIIRMIRIFSTGVRLRNVFLSPRRVLLMAADPAALIRQSRLRESTLIRRTERNYSSSRSHLRIP